MRNEGGGNARRIPQALALALDGIEDAFFKSVPFRRVAAVREARERIESMIGAELQHTAEDAFLAAARICESRSRTLRSKPAAFESLQCGSAIQRNGFIELERLQEERPAGAHSPDACVAEHPSVGTETL